MSDDCIVNFKMEFGKHATKEWSKPALPDKVAAEVGLFRSKVLKNNVNWTQYFLRA
jgi:hypothetical protein